MTASTQPAIETLADALRALRLISEADDAHTLQAFGEGCVSATRRQRIRGSDPVEYREVVGCPVCYAKAALTPVSPSEPVPQQTEATA